MIYCRRGGVAARESPKHEAGSGAETEDLHLISGGGGEFLKTEVHWEWGQAGRRERGAGDKKTELGREIASLLLTVC